ncbi:MAG TPA: hypothetical protein VLF20_04415 [Patescibacteria group bacterium]|nr:hypothetical protein [Patescibacteria group bacterium]
MIKRFTFVSPGNAEKMRGLASQVTSFTAKKTPGSRRERGTTAFDEHITPEGLVTVRVYGVGRDSVLIHDQKTGDGVSAAILHGRRRRVTDVRVRVSSGSDDSGTTLRRLLRSAQHAVAPAR